MSRLVLQLSQDPLNNVLARCARWKRSQKTICQSWICLISTRRTCLRSTLSCTVRTDRTTCWGFSKRSWRWEIFKGTKSSSRSANLSSSATERNKMRILTCLRKEFVWNARSRSKTTWELQLSSKSLRGAQICSASSLCGWRRRCKVTATALRRTENVISLILLIFNLLHSKLFISINQVKHRD